LIGTPPTWWQLAAEEKVESAGRIAGGPWGAA